MRLSQATADRLVPGVTRFAYDREAQGVGIVHFGIGAFHRAHHAWYTDRAMDAGERDWMIAGVSLRSADVAEQLNPQDGLYTVAERSDVGDAVRLVGAVREVLIAARSRASVAISLITPSTQIVSFTVTEKGYCRAANGSLDFARADAGSFYPLLLDAFKQRRAARIEGLTLLSCDNLADNGRQLERLMGEYLDRHDPALRAWFDAECACPPTMVDRIVPATADTDRADLAARIGMEDQGAVMTEPFSQWVIEDRFAGSRPRWEAVGVELVADVRSYETAKLRMLNGAHSLLAYCGLSCGYTFVHEAVADPELRALVERLMLAEAAPTIAAAPGQDLARYAHDLVARFANPALNHRLIQIAMDGSQKIPQRWLETLAANQNMGRLCPAILEGLGAWLRHVRGDNRGRWGAVDDPLAPLLMDCWVRHGADGILAALFGPEGLLGTAWTPSPDEQARLHQAIALPK